MKHWSFQFRVLPFGMCNAPATFQRTMDALMRKHWAYADVYLDDIIIHSNSMAEHIEHVRAISEDLRKEQLYAKLKKCEFGKDHVEFCGFVVSHNVTSTQESKVRTIRDRPTPTNVADIKSFLGLCGFYQCFILKYAQITTPMTELLKKKNAWKWEAEK